MFFCGYKMAISFKKLWHILSDRDMLQKSAVLTHYTINKLSRNETVTTKTLMKTCTALNCGFDDIMEIVKLDNYKY